MILFEWNGFEGPDKKSGDRERQQNAVDAETNLSQNYLDNIREGMINPTASMMFNNSAQASGNAFADYGDIMNRYRSQFDNPQNQVTADTVTPERVSYNRTPEMGEALAGYGDFSRTGGFTDEGIRDIRSRGISPIRAAYGDTMRDLDRSRSLGGGGGATNYIAARSQANRMLPQQLSDATQSVNADIARMVQSGRLSGLGGLASTATTDTGFGQQAQLANQGASMSAALANQSARLNAAQANQGNQLAGLSGMSNLYSATPGQASVFGNQLLNSGQNVLNLQQLQQQKGQQKIAGQGMVAGIPTGFQAALGNVGKIGDIAGDFATAFL